MKLDHFVNKKVVNCYELHYFWSWESSKIKIVDVQLSFQAKTSGSNYMDGVLQPKELNLSRDFYNPLKKFILWYFLLQIGNRF